MRNSVINKLFQAAKEDSDVMLLVGDLGFGVVTEFSENLPSQFINVGVAEQNLTGVATGLSLLGKKTITYSIGNFNTLRCLEQIRNDSLYHETNLTIISVGGGFSYGQLGFSHHATEDYGILRTLPGITIFTPGSKKEAIECLNKSLKIDNVCYIRIDKSDFKDDFEINDISVPRELIKGDEFLIVGVGGVIEEGMQAVEYLKENLNISVGLVSLPQLKPIDEEYFFRILSNYKKILTIEEHNLVNGLSAIVKEVCFNNSFLPEAFFNLGINDELSSKVGDQKYLRSCFGIDSNSIIKIISENS